MERSVLALCLIGSVGLTSGSRAANAEPTGGVKGSVIFDGPAPERENVRRDTDPYCASTDARSEDVIVTAGKVKDVLIRVKNGTKAVALAPPAAPPAPAVIDQKDCRYSPHVIGLVAGQKLAIHNSDATFHNVHGSVAGKLTWNKPAAPGDPDLVLDASAGPGGVVDIVCDVHPWMHAYAVVQDHTAFTVTGDDGNFELRGLPPGSYTIEAWHPVLGAKSQRVTIGKGVATARFTYRPADVKPSTR